MRKIERVRLLFAVGVLLGSGVAPIFAGERVVDRLQTEARGIHLLWADGKPDETDILRQPFIHGGQVVVQWADIEPGPGKFDFKALDSKLAYLAGMKKWATIQVNGNLKPGWLFDSVPSVPKQFHQQVQDKRGTLMFWHPNFVAAHLNMLRALAAHLHRSPFRDRLLGIRMNFNAVGTEQLHVPEEYRNPRAWRIPSGVSIADVPVYSESVQQRYVAQTVDTYEKEFSGWAVVFVRNLVDGEVLARIAPDLRNGKLGLFHTSSEVEPRTALTERRYGMFYDYARSGETVAYAEPWASAWGEHGGKSDVRWCSPCQWNYWTLLFNLHCGVSFIGEYYINLHFARTAEHPRRMKDTVFPREQAEEFLEAYRWVDSYAGRHNRPLETPGAWVAFRQNAEIKAKNSIGPRDGWTLKRFAGDYNFLMERIDGDDSVGIGPIGPPEQRYGAFARKLPAGQAIRLKLDPEFRRVLAAIEGRLRVIYLDDSQRPDADVCVGDHEVGRLTFTASQRWVIAEMPVPGDMWTSAGADWQIAIKSGSAPLTLHLAEMRR